MATKEKELTEGNGLGMDAKGMIEENAKEKTVIRYGDRMKLKIITNTKHYKEGQIINPHTVMAKQLIKDGIAQEVK